MATGRLSQFSAWVRSLGPIQRLDDRREINPLSKTLVTLVGTWSAFGSDVFDWNRTHIYSPRWPPHAKFHNAQTMLLGSLLRCSRTRCALLGGAGSAIS